MIAAERALLTYEEAERILGLSHRAIQRMGADGRLTMVGRGPSRRITRASLDRYCGAAK